MIADKIRHIMSNHPTVSYAQFIDLWKSQYKEQVPSQGYFYDLKRHQSSNIPQNKDKVNAIQEILVSSGADITFVQFEKIWTDKYGTKPPCGPHFYRTRKEFLGVAQGEKRACFGEAPNDPYEKLESTLDELVALASTLNNTSLTNQLKNARRIASSEIIRKVLS